MHQTVGVPIPYTTALQSNIRTMQQSNNINRCNGIFLKAFFNGIFLKQIAHQDTFSNLPIDFQEFVQPLLFQTLLFGTLEYYSCLAYIREGEWDI